MTTLVKSNKELVAVSRTIKGTSFVGIQQYRNKQGELSNYVILVGATHENILKRDMKKLIENKQKVVGILLQSYSIEVIEKAYKNVYDSVQKRLLPKAEKELLKAQGDKTIISSEAQKDAYVTLSKGVKMHLDTKEIHIFGYGISKKVIEPIDYEDKEDTRRELTRCQDKIKSLCNFKNNKYKEFFFNDGIIKMQGFEL